MDMLSPPLQALFVGDRGLSPMGIWSASEVYPDAALVVYNSDWYLSKRSVPATIPPTDDTYWEKYLDVSAISVLTAQALQSKDAAQVAATNALANLRSFWATFLGAFPDETHALAFAGSKGIALVDGLTYYDQALSAFRVLISGNWNHVLATRPRWIDAIDYTLTIQDQYRDLIFSAGAIVRLPSTLSDRFSCTIRQASPDLLTLQLIPGASFMPMDQPLLATAYRGDLLKLSVAINASGTSASWYVDPR